MAEETVDVEDVGTEEAGGFSLEEFPDKIRPLMAEFDLDGSGAISAAELAHAAHLLREAQDSAKKMKRLAIGVSALLVLTLGTIFGLVWAVVSAMKDTQSGSDEDASHMTIRGGPANGTLVTTGSVKSHKEYDAAISSMTPDSVLERLSKFTIDGRTSVTLDVLGYGRRVLPMGDVRPADITTLQANSQVLLFTPMGILSIDAYGNVFSNNSDLHEIFATEHNEDALNAPSSSVNPANGRRQLTARLLPGTAADTSTAAKTSGTKPATCPIGKGWSAVLGECFDCPHPLVNKDGKKADCVPCKPWEIRVDSKTCKDVNVADKCRISRADKTGLGIPPTKTEMMAAGALCTPAYMRPQGCAYPKLDWTSYDKAYKTCVGQGGWKDTDVPILNKIFKGMMDGVA